MAFNQIIVILAIIASATVSGAGREPRNKLERVIKWFEYEQNINIFFEIIDFFSSSYESHRLNNVEKFIVNSLQKAQDTEWVHRTLNRMSGLRTKDFKNDFFIKLFKEMKNRGVVGRFDEGSLKCIIDSMTQCYIRVNNPFWWSHWFGTGDHCEFLRTANISFE